MEQDAAQEHLLPPPGEQLFVGVALCIPPVPDRLLAEPELEDRADPFDDDRQARLGGELVQPGHQRLAQFALPLVQARLG